MQSPRSSLPRPQRSLVRAVAWLFAVYASFCVAGCLGYRTFLYPAPSDAISPYTSITAMASRALPLLPTRWLCPDKYDSLSKAPRVNVPALVIHGDQDEVVPFAMGQQVAAAIPGARVKVVPGGHHNDLFKSDGPELEDAIAEAARR